MTASHHADELALREHEQLLLAAGYLRLMNADLAVETTAEAIAVRDAFRESLESGPLGPKRPDRLAIEDAQEVFEDLAHAADDTPRTLAVLTDLCFSQPFAEQERTLQELPRRRTLEALAIATGCEVDEDDVERIDEWLREGQQASKSKALTWVLLGLGGVAGVATAGLAAPAIGAAIGGAMGLSGAAAASAGLAALGGGSLAAGGFGMAGGTIVVMATGSALGAGLGAVIGSVGGGRRAEAEAVKLFALTRAFDWYAAAAPTERYARLAKTCRDGLDRLTETLQLETARAGDRGDWEQASDLDGAAAVTRRLRERLG